jgi:hypothetical protein
MIPKILGVSLGAVLLVAVCLEAIVRLLWHYSSYSVCVVLVETIGRECGQPSGLLVRRHMLLFL